MEYLKWDNNVYEIWLIAVREVSPPFDEEPCTALEQGISFIFFPANKERSQLWNSTVNRYGYNERVHRKKQHASSFHTIP